MNRTTVANVTAGYTSNVVGFGWTNGTFLVLLNELPARERQSVLDDPDPPTADVPQVVTAHSDL